RARELGQARRVGRRRGRDGRDARPPVPRGTVGDEVAMTPDELRTLFLFEKLTDEQLAWLAARGAVREYPAGTLVIQESDPAECFFVLLSGTISMFRRVGQDDVETVRTDQRGVYMRAMRAYLNDEDLK